MNIIDNFLPKNQLNYIKDLIYSKTFSWYLSGVTTENDNSSMLGHVLYENNKENSDFCFPIMNIFLDKIKIKKLLRAKVNFYFRTKKIEKHSYHVDNDQVHKVAIFYLNSNNGKTLFENKSVRSIENRLLLFNGNIKHASTSCSNAERRINLNINYN